MRAAPFGGKFWNFHIEKYIYKEEWESVGNAAKSSHSQENEISAALGAMCETFDNLQPQFVEEYNSTQL